MKHRIVVYKPLPDDVLAALRARADVVLAEGADALARALPDAD
ncbi:bifunctional glyoxylate/hydroxypyruvate reductase B, partial [Burkholderia mallei]|nr:bifunctional glyoxylate/hydroxypyruvate reductase B [Burkholderia mallei]